MKLTRAMLEEAASEGLPEAGLMAGVFRQRRAADIGAGMRQCLPNAVRLLVERCAA